MSLTSRTVRLRLTALVAALAATYIGISGYIRSGIGTAAEDSTHSLQAQLDGLKPGGVLRLTPQDYYHSGVLKVRVPDVHIDGNGATLHATNDASSSVQLEAAGVRLTNIILTAPTQGKRWSAREQHKLVMSGTGDSVQNVTIIGSAAAGIFVDGAQDFSIRDVSVSHTRADGIHITNGAARGVVQGVRTELTGDDAVAVVSYLADGHVCSDIRISGVTVEGTRWGRGISVVGGRGVSISDFAVSRTDSAGVYIASEGAPYFTASVDDVSVANGSISRANTNPAVVQGAVLVYSGNAMAVVQNVHMSNLRIAYTPATAQRDVAIVTSAGGRVEGVSLRDFDITGSVAAPLYSTAGTGAYVASGWSRNGLGIEVR
ncbi:putative glycoside hydrolase [Gordonia rhizosphera NBRC 16068]|uniref:Putative glycoside hydrolase n=1 Tax=Gordonia rhizosphera NBRC 16068 TaxID=1108045 RepID=K6WC87_9ACTN|nr:putative glycoside hydrolase [Gordonia rhizosphera NBRC 16068]